MANPYPDNLPSKLGSDTGRALFDALDEGYCVIEFFDGPHGPLSDYIHVEANDAYARNAGIPNVVGQKVREMVGDEADGWVARYGEVLRTGKPIRFEQELVATGRHLDLAAFRLEPPELNQVAVVFRDVSQPQAGGSGADANSTRTLEARVEGASSPNAKGPRKRCARRRRWRRSAS